MDVIVASLVYWVSKAQVLPHMGPFDPISSDPLTSILIRLGLAASAGVVGAGAAVVTARRLWTGDVPLVVMVSLIREKDFVDVTAREAWGLLFLVAPVLGVISQGVGIALFGIPGSPVGGIQWLQVQTLIAASLAMITLYLGGVLVVKSRYRDDLERHPEITRHWLVCSLVFGLGFFLTRVAMFAGLFGR